MSDKAEKERRRREREAAEQAAKASAARRKRLGIVAGGVLVAAIAVVVALAALGGNGDSGSGPGGGGAGSALPARQTDNLAEAAREAGCKVVEQPPVDSSHTGEEAKYATNPPTSGNHSETAAREGIYASDNPPAVGEVLHAYEHGRVGVQYKPGTPEQRVAQLRTLYAEEVQGFSGYKTLLFQNTTSMPFAVAAAAWGNALHCPSWNDRVFDALRAFREEFHSKGPEAVPSEFESG